MHAGNLVFTMFTCENTRTTQAVECGNTKRLYISFGKKLSLGCHSF